MSGAGLSSLQVFLRDLPDDADVLREAMAFIGKALDDIGGHHGVPAELMGNPLSAAELKRAGDLERLSERLRAFEPRSASEIQAALVTQNSAPSLRQFAAELLAIPSGVPHGYRVEITSTIKRALDEALEVESSPPAGVVDRVSWSSLVEFLRDEADGLPESFALAHVRLFADLVDEVLQVGVRHQGSPSVGDSEAATSDVGEPSVGDAVGAGESPTPVPAAPSVSANEERLALADGFDSVFAWRAWLELEQLRRARG